MSIRHNGKIIAGATQYHPDLFDVKWADHQLDDAQWLRADTFSWQSGAVYQAAYQHLTADITGKTLQSETIGETTIQFYLADDGHKICPASEESNVASIYSATGVAWYYIIDTTNQRFKLPRTKFGFTGIRSGVGDYVEAGLPNITGSSYGYVSSANRGASGALQMSGGSAKDATGGGGWWVEGVTVSVNASNSSSVYGNSNTVQPKATEMYLYFYVGQFTQTALENTAGLNTELFNGKADVSTVAHVVVEFQEPTSANNYTWYRKYADGWVEQGGRVQLNGTISATNKRVTFPVEMVNTQYVASAASNANVASLCFVGWESTTGMSIGVISGSNTGWTTWQVSGMAA